LLQTSVQTAWSARPGCIVSMLSLDLAGAFDNVSHDRLLAILQAKGFPDWIVQIVRSFLQGRRTQIALPISPDKYKLIHFTRQRRRTDDLASSIRAGDHPVKPEAEIRVLGVWADSKLQWKEHVKRATSKGAAAYEAMSRITASTWGPSMKRSRLIYAATVRPVLLYGAATWAVRDNGEPAAESLLRPLKQVQNKCIRRVTGAYKRTPIAAVEREAEIPPLDLHADVVALRHAARTQQHPVTREIAHAADQIWASLQAAPARRVAGARRTPRPGTQTRPKTGPELLRLRAEERAQEIRAWEEHCRDRDGPQAARTRGMGGRRTGRRRAAGGSQRPAQSKVPITKWAGLRWERRWKNTARTQTARGHVP
jgi:hypothetical protein